MTFDLCPEFDPPLDEEDHKALRHVTRHEAGHYIVGRVLGFRMNGLNVMLRERGGYSGGAKIQLGEDLSGDDDVLDYLERRVMVLYAGALSEALGAGNGVIDNEKALQSSQDGSFGDKVKVVELLNLIRNIRHDLESTDSAYEKQLAAIDIEMWNKSATLVTENHELIEDLASRMASEVKAIGVLFELDEETINAMPEIEKRFPSV
jgi:hypothetical protein